MILDRIATFLLFNVIERALNRIEKFFNNWYFYLTLKRQQVNYKSIPHIRGRIKLVNNGSCSFGADIIFNNNFTSNPIGLYKNCTLFVEKKGSLVIGDYSGFSGVSIYCCDRITIGKNLFCGGNVSIWDTDFHSLNYLERRLDDNFNVKSFPITIGDDVFLGANSIIIKGVTIGDRSVIGAGSVVTGNIPADQIWAGNPAKFIRNNKATPDS